MATTRREEPPAARPRRGAFIGLPRVALVVLALLILAGGALRAATAAGAGDHQLSADERAYARLAIDLDAKHAYGPSMERPLHWPPGAPAMFAVAHRIAPDPDLPAAYWLQALCGTLVIPLVFALALLLSAKPVAALAAAAIAAFYPPQIALSGTLLSEGLGTSLLVAAALATVWALRRARTARFALAGAVFALALLTRADMVLAPLFVAAPIVLAAWRTRRRDLAAGAATLLAATALVLAPWIAHASDQAGGFVLVTQGDAAPLFIGTLLPGDGRTSGMKDVFGPEIQKQQPRYRDRWVRLIPASVVLDHVAERHPELDRDAALRREALANLRRYALGDPLRFAGMMAEKVARMLVISSRVGSPTAHFGTRAAHAVIVVGAILLSLAALLFPKQRRLGLLVVLSIPLYSALLHAVVVSKARYNLPLVPLLAAAGCAAAAMLLAHRRAAPRHDAATRS
jgi:4-amino-4-deoxy-L-arabinose transferase-like glycosyltransferase